MLPDGLREIAFGPHQGSPTGLDLPMADDLAIDAIALLLVGDERLLGFALRLEPTAPFGRHQTDAAKLGRQPLDAGLGDPAQLMHPARNLGIDAGVGDLVEQRRAILRAGPQKGIDIALRQKNGAPELLEGESGCSFNLPVDLGPGPQSSRSSITDPGQRALDPLQLAVWPIARPPDLPARQIMLPVQTDELGLGTPQAAPLLRIERSSPAASSSSLTSAIFSGRHGRRADIARKWRGRRHRDRRFASAGRTGDGKKTGTLQRLGSQIDDEGLYQARQAFSGDLRMRMALDLFPRCREGPQVNLRRRHLMAGDEGLGEEIERIDVLELGRCGPAALPACSIAQLRTISGGAATLTESRRRSRRPRHGSPPPYHSP